MTDAISPDSADFVYDEFAYFHENVAEHGLEVETMPPVERVDTVVHDDVSISALRWGGGAPAAVFLHGGAQNAHTWDTVLLDLGVPALAVDLPGHGASGWRSDRRYDPRSNADSVTAALDSWLERPVVLVGMSLGGLTATAIAARRPDVVERLVVVDVTPGVNSDKASEIHAFVAGPQSFPSFEEIFARTKEFNPTRSDASLRRGILHNAHRLADGSWEWNYDRRPLADLEAFEMGDLWEDVAGVASPYTLVRGALSPVTDEDDVARVRELQPEVRVVTVDDAGHSVQGDRPRELAGIVSEELGAAR